MLTKLEDARLRVAEAMAQALAEGATPDQVVRYRAHRRVAAHIDEVAAKAGVVISADGRAEVAAKHAEAAAALRDVLTSRTFARLRDATAKLDDELWEYAEIEHGDA